MSLFVDVYCYPSGSSCTVYPCGRLNVLGKYVYVSFHPYLGPEFSRGDDRFEPANEAEEEALWAAFGKWFDKFKANEAKLKERGKSLYRRIDVH